MWLRFRRTLWTAAVVSAALALSACGGSSFSLANGGDDGGATSDGGEAGAEASAPFCASAGSHFFCDDFDERATGDVKGGWDLILTSGNVVLTLDTANPRSAPADLLAQLAKPGATSTNDQGALAKKVGRARAVTLEFDMLIDAYGNASGASMPTNVAVPVDFQIASGVGLGLGLITPDVAYLYESTGSGSTQAHQLGMGIPVGRWTHVSVHVEPPSFFSSKGNAHVEIDGKLALDTSLSIAQNAVTSDSSIDLGLLFPTSGTASSAWSFHFDNVTIDRTLLP